MVAAWLRLFIQQLELESWGGGRSPWRRCRCVVVRRCIILVVVCLVVVGVGVGHRSVAVVGRVFVFVFRFAVKRQSQGLIFVTENVPVEITVGISTEVTWFKF